MTDRQRFENNALNNEATIIKATNTMLKIVSSNGILTTTYIFDESGKFLRIFH